MPIGNHILVSAYAHKLILRITMLILIPDHVWRIALLQLMGRIEMLLSEFVCLLARDCNILIARQVIVLMFALGMLTFMDSYKIKHV